jgi:hypothetical protein
MNPIAQSLARYTLIYTYPFILVHTVDIKTDADLEKHGMPETHCFILSRLWVTYKKGFGLVMGFIDHSLCNQNKSSADPFFHDCIGLIPF